MTTVGNAEHDGIVGLDDALNKSGLIKLTGEQRKAAEELYSFLRKNPKAQTDRSLQEELSNKLASFKSLLLKGKKGDAVGNVFMQMIEFNTLAGLNYGSVHSV